MALFGSDHEVTQALPGFWRQGQADSAETSGGGNHGEHGEHWDKLDFKIC